MASIAISLLLLLLASLTNSRSLSEVICGSSRPNCLDKPPVKSATPRDRNRPKHQDFTSPSFKELMRWENYEQGEQGTGLHPDGETSVGLPNGVPYGPGLGDVEVRTGLGVNYGVGDVGIRRDFGLFMGGCGRSGGQAFGWGNGCQRRSGAAPWAWP